LYQNNFFLIVSNLLKLKPCCVKISQLAIRDSDKPATHRELLSLTQELLTILIEATRKDAASLDEKLAEYVFFPLYHIFRQMELFPMLLIENCIKCLSILISHGWRSKISPKLVQQILGLIIFIVDGVPGKDNKREIPEEIALESFRVLTTLFNISATSMTAASALSEPDALPALGHGITVMLEGVTSGANSPIQQEALRSVQSIYTTLKDPTVLAQFLPGTTSALTRVLSTPSRYKTAVLEQTLRVLSLVLTKVLGDMQTRTILAKSDRQKKKKINDEEEEDISDKNEILSPSWLKATTAQVKRALSTIMKLRSSDSPEVRDALRSLCLKLLDECHLTLADSSFLLVESAVVLEKPETHGLLTESSLRDLVSIYPELGEKVKTVVYNGMTSLARTLQSSDEDIRRTALRNLATGLRLLRELRIESTTLEETISGTLRDGVVLLMAGSKAQQTIVGLESLTLEESSSTTLMGRELQYPAVLLGHESQKQTRLEMLNLVAALGEHEEPSALAMNMLEFVRESEAENQIAAFWLCFEMVKAAHASHAEEDALLDMSAFTSSGDDLEAVYEELYTFSVQVLDSQVEMTSVDWRLAAIALEVTAYAAHRTGQAFRPELIDVLFPIVTFLGSDVPRLREHTISTLNQIAVSCLYDSVSELIIENVDYMVNSVALRLNTLDISPASTQVLTMMIRLTGPRLVPFLDDVVDAIFSALENYHGYPFFVESLFSVLKELVDQAVRSDTLLLEGQKKTIVDHKKKRPPRAEYGDLLEFLEKRRMKREQDKKEEEEDVIEIGRGHPSLPWKKDEAGGVEDEEQQDAGPEPEPEKPPNSTSYQLLLRVTTLTQHYLTSPTPRLRRSLLELLSTASPALAADEDSFLPLINAIWPVVISRLYDSESFIAIEACRALSALCAAAGDFLASRFSTEWDDGLRNWCRRAKGAAVKTGSQAKVLTSGGTSFGKEKIMFPTAGGELVTAKSNSDHVPPNEGGLGHHASPFRVWEAVSKLLTSMASHVRLTDAMFEDILDLLADLLEKNGEVREALETVDADAVWLKRYERGTAEWLPTPVMDGVVFTSMRKLEGRG
jgi:TELO2-interacting protein 1